MHIYSTALLLALLTAAEAADSPRTLNLVAT